MRFLLDTNIWIDIAARPKTFPDSKRLFLDLESKNHTICLPLSAYTTIYYLIKHLLSHTAAKEFVRTLHFRRINFLPFSEKEISRAWELGFGDHEDACIAASAIIHKVDLIVTRNESDFKKSPIKALSPKGVYSRRLL